MEYLFEYQEVSAPSVVPSPGNWQPVTPTMIGKTIIGYLFELTGDPMNPVETIDYYINGDPTTEKVASFNGKLDPSSPGAKLCPTFWMQLSCSSIPKQ
ncbi:MAG: hypothetical protein HC880_04965 [Bacteroidia bacterium]|nr:hypothetical protein [Bacteroidia bacterium]